MIRFPKRNIAQPRKKPEPKEPEKIIVEDLSMKERTELAAQVGISAPTRLTSSRVANFSECQHAGHLYPKKLWDLHQQLEAAAAGESVLVDGPGGKKQRVSAWHALPPSLKLAEQQADKLLTEFVDEKISQIGVQRFYQNVEAAMSDKSRLIFAYRCVIACVHEYVPDTLEVFVNEGMQAWDFYDEEDVTKTVNPITGAVSVSIDDSKYDGPYDRGMQLISKKHRKVASCETSKAPTSKDKMPPHVLLRMKSLLQKAGHSVPNDAKEAWRYLEDVSTGATIEERIVGRIAYLIANAVMNKKQKQLPK